MTFLDLVVKALACWRLAFMLTKEAGPGLIFQRTRRMLGVERVDPDTGRVSCTGTHPQFGMFCCVFCMSIWTAAVVSRTLNPVKVLAVSAGALVVDRIVQS